jgi:hypothetical protein
LIIFDFEYFAKKIKFKNSKWQSWSYLSPVQERAHLFSVCSCFSAVGSVATLAAVFALFIQQFVYRIFGEKLLSSSHF